MSKKLIIITALGVALHPCSPVAARAADFRIENRVFVSSSKEPTAESTTLFYRGTVYDFLEKPAEITVFDPLENRFVLLDVDRGMKTELSTKTIDATLVRLKRLAETSKDPKVRFLYRPEFAQTIDPKTNELVFESDWMTYRVTTVAAEDAALARQYRQFCDAYANLNMFLRPGSRPPYPRLIVSDAIEKRGEIPTAILLVLKYQRGLDLRQERLRSEHRFVKRLLESDRDRIVAAGEQMASFKAVDLRQYENRQEPPAR
ncbi:MAG: hypothetical protein GX621_09740 [Pirellulaceae bacterium]|nr:hypothetical protein [Pirellulaceae bacterium]